MNTMKNEKTKTMKRALIVLLASLMVLPMLAACEGNSKNMSATKTPSDNHTNAEAVPPDIPAHIGEKLFGKWSGYSQATSITGLYEVTFTDGIYTRLYDGEVTDKDQPYSIGRTRSGETTIRTLSGNENYLIDDAFSFTENNTILWLWGVKFTRVS